MDLERGIGQSNALPWHLPADLKHFKALTYGKPILMGRKTFESIGKPLPGRLNIVLSQQSFSMPDVHVVASWVQALALIGAVPELMIIGGATIYEQFMARADYLYLTEIHHVFQADCFFPSIDPKIWQLVKEESQGSDEKNLYDLSFKEYQRFKPSVE